jgi:hypothetical protein
MKYITPTITAFNSPYLSNKNTGLGNVLFQISSIYGMSKDLDISCTYPMIYYFGRKLKELYGFNHCDTIFRNVPYDLSIEFNQQLCEMPSNNKLYDIQLYNNIKSSINNQVIHGYLENTKYFSKYKDDIINLFTIDDASITYIKNKYPILFDNRNTVAVHYRAGDDFLNNHHKINYEYYRKAYEYIISKIDNPIFLIFTDNIKIIDLSIYNNNYIYITGNQDYIDLWCMSLCKHYILSASTFCWWGQYLNTNLDKIVLYDKHIQYELYNDYISI